MRKIVCIFAFTFIIALQAYDAWATTRTVCSSGCDSTTVQGAVNASSGGDVIQIKTGTYDGITTIIGDYTPSGLIIEPFGDGDVTLRDGSDARVFLLNGCDGVTIRSGNGNTIALSSNSGSSDYMIYFYSLVTDTTIDGLTITGGSNTDMLIMSGLNSGDGLDNVSLLNNTFAGDVGSDAFIQWGSQTSTGYTYIRDNTFDCSSLTGSTVMFWEYYNQNGSSSGTCWFERNYIYGITSNITVAAVYIRNTDYLYFRNNVIYQIGSWNPSSGMLHAYSGSGDSTGVGNIYITNNTFSIAGSVSAAMIWNEGSENVDNVKVTNNLYIGPLAIWNAQYNTGSDTNCEFKNNHTTDNSLNWFEGGGTFTGWVSSGNTDSQSDVWNNSPPDFDLTESLDGASFAWDPTDDYNEDVRAATPDVGAYEYGSDTTPSQSGVTLSGVTIGQ
jgi:hypothetical protein